MYYSLYKSDLRLANKIYNNIFKNKKINKYIKMKAQIKLFTFILFLEQYRVILICYYVCRYTYILAVL